MKSGNVFLFHERFFGSIACVTMTAVKFWSSAKTTLNNKMKGGAAWRANPLSSFTCQRTKYWLIIIHRKPYYAIKLHDAYLECKGFIKWVFEKEKEKEVHTIVMNLDMAWCLLPGETTKMYARVFNTVSTMRWVRIPRV